MRIAMIALLAALGGCTTVSKMSTGEQTVAGRLTVRLDGAWNQVVPVSAGPAHLWTMEGLPVDELRIYAGIKDGELLHLPDPAGKQKSFSFRSGMQADDIVAMFEGMLTRDGSVFKLAKLEPVTFAGEKGLRFEFSVVRKVDGVQLAGVGYAAVAKDELFAMLYAAPRLGFFPRHRDSVEQMARSAKLKM